MERHVRSMKQRYRSGCRPASSGRSTLDPRCSVTPACTARSSRKASQRTRLREGLLPLVTLDRPRQACPQAATTDRTRPVPRPRPSRAVTQGGLPTCRSNPPRANTGAKSSSQWKKPLRLGNGLCDGQPRVTIERIDDGDCLGEGPIRVFSDVEFVPTEVAGEAGLPVLLKLSRLGRDTEDRLESPDPLIPVVAARCRW